MKKKFLVLLMAFPLFANSQIFVENVQMNQAINDFFVGNGVFISNLTFNGYPFNTTTGQVGYFLADTAEFPFAEGIVMSTGNVENVIGPNNSTNATDNSNVFGDPNDADLAALVVPHSMWDEAVLEFDFVPAGDSVVFEYIFASEEYHEYSTSSYNDGFGFFISGPGISGPYTNGAENIALIPGTLLPVTMNNLNNGTTNSGPCTNCSFLVDNPPGSPYLQFDGRTVALKAIESVVCGETYHLKLAIGDAGDMNFDSGVFLKGSSFISNGIGLTIGADQAYTFLNTEIVEGCDSVGFFLSLPDWAIGTGQEVFVTTGGNAILDSDYTISDTLITFGLGDSLLPLFINPLIDGLIEPNDSIILGISFLTPCGDTLGIEKVIHLDDFETLSLTSTQDTLLNCPNQQVLIETEVIGNSGSNDFPTWSNGSTAFSQYVAPMGDTVFYVQVLTGCSPQPILFDTVNVSVTSDLYGSVEDNGLCPGDSLIQLTYIGNADSTNWIGDELTDSLDLSDQFYTLMMYDTVNGCVDSIIHQIVLHPQTYITIYNLGGVLSSDIVTTYQWFYEGDMLTGETNQTYTPTDTGSYFVNGTDTNGCEVWSDTILVTSLLTLDESSQNTLEIYPNPAKDLVQISLPDTQTKGEIRIYGIGGNVILEEEVNQGKQKTIDVSAMASGTYLIEFVGSGQPYYAKLNIE